jgi:hypothetical protein
LPIAAASCALAFPAGGVVAQDPDDDGRRTPPGDPNGRTCSRLNSTSPQLWPIPGLLPRPPHHPPVWTTGTASSMRGEQRYWDEHVAPLLDGADVEVLRNGTKQDAIDIMSGAEATLFPISWPEPFGLVMVESMAVGTPVIAYAAGASLEVIDSGRTGVLVPPDDLDAFVAAVPSAGSFDRAMCRAHVVEHFSSAAMVAGYEAVFAATTGTATAASDQRSRVEMAAAPQARVGPQAGSPTTRHRRCTASPWRPARCRPGLMVAAAQTVGPLGEVTASAEGPSASRRPADRSDPGRTATGPSWRTRGS